MTPDEHLSHAAQECRGYSRRHSTLGEGIYFGADAADYDGRRPMDWFHDNHEAFILPFERIHGARQEYTHFAGPSGEGIYFLFAGEQLSYVGQSRTINYRICQHNFPWLTHFSALWVPRDFLDTVEAYYLYLLRPPRNIRYLPADRHAQRYLDRHKP